MTGRGPPWERLPAAIKALLACSLVWITACTTVGPDFVQPEAPVNDQWLDDDAEHFRVTPQELTEWWRVFEDPVLEELVRLTHERNNNLKIVGLRVLEAQANLGIATGGRYPQVQVLTGQALAIGTSEGDENAVVSDLEFRKYDLGVGVSWEMDFWGRFRRGIESADAALLASIASYDDLFVLLTASVADVYTIIRTLEEQLVVTAENLANQQRSYDIVKVLYENGDSSELDMIQARTLLLSTQAAVPELETGLRQAKNALSTLIGMPPADLTQLLAPSARPRVPDNILVGVPGDLLRQRPDIRQAELLARAQNAAVGLSEANLYPSFSIGGSLGVSSTENTNSTRSSDDGIGGLLDAGNLTYAVGPAFVWPFLNYGRIKNSVRVQDARLQQALINYRETVIQAAREVEDAMAAYSNALIQDQILSETVAAAERSTELALLRYKEGLADYQRVLTAQQALFTQQARYVSNKGEMVSSLVAVYRALGGGWQNRDGSFVDDETRQIMNERTDWGELLQSPDTPP
jgi:NodT family efflux transporter outer membrane factor (OMF) lipoprotein